MYYFDELKDDEVIEHNRQNLANKAAILVVRDKDSRENAVAKVKRYNKDVSDAEQEAIERDGTEDAAEAYTQLGKIDFSTMTKQQSRQVKPVAESILRSGLINNDD